MIRIGLPRYITGDDLVTLRHKIGWSQQAVAEYLGLGHESLLNQIENGRRWISYDEEDLLKQLEEAFDRGELQGAGLRPSHNAHEQVQSHHVVGNGYRTNAFP